MIERLQVIATHLLPFRLLMALIAMLSLAVLVLSLLETDWLAGDELIIPSILCFSWSVALFSFSGMFAYIPQPPGKGAGWRARASYRLRRGTVWLLGLLMLALTGSLVVLTFELLRAGTVG